MNRQLVGKVGIVVLVAVVSFLAAWSGSGPAWGAVSAIAIGGGVAVAVSATNLTATCPTDLDTRDRTESHDSS